MKAEGSSCFSRNRHLPIIILIGFSIVFVLLTYSFAINTYDQRDTAIEAQTMWLALHGKPVFTTIIGEYAYTNHVKPILGALSPILLVWPSARALLFLQAVFLAAGAVILYFLCLEYFPERKCFALGISAAYLSYWVIWHMEFEGFYADALAIPFFFAAWLFLNRKQWGWYYASILGALACYEWHALTIAFIGIYIAVVKKDRKNGLITAALGVGWLLACFWIIGSTNGTGYSVYYSNSALGHGSFPWSLVTAIAIGLTASTLVLLLDLIAPTGFLALLAPEVLVLCAMTYIGIFSGIWTGDSHRVYVQPFASFSVFAFVAILEGIKKHPGIPLEKAAVLVLACSLLTLALLWLPTANYVRPVTIANPLTPSPIDSLLSVIPPDASVSFDQQGDSASAALRQNAFVFPNPLLTIEYGAGYPHPLLPPRYADYFILNSTGTVTDKGRTIGPETSLIEFYVPLKAGWIRKIYEYGGYSLYQTVNKTAEEEFEDYYSCQIPGMTYPQCITAAAKLADMPKLCGIISIAEFPKAEADNCSKAATPA